MENTKWKEIEESIAEEFIEWAFEEWVSSSLREASEAQYADLPKDQ